MNPTTIADDFFRSGRYHWVDIKDVKKRQPFMWAGALVIKRYDDYVYVDTGCPATILMEDVLKFEKTEVLVANDEIK